MGNAKFPRYDANAGVLVETPTNCLTNGLSAENISLSAYTCNKTTAQKRSTFVGWWSLERALLPRPAAYEAAALLG